MDIRQLLPIGSVVLLKGGRKKVMIYGVKQTDKSSGIEYDYISVLYPEGNMGEAGQSLFIHSDIDEIYFWGCEDEERDRFIDKLARFYENK